MPKDTLAYDDAAERIDFSVVTGASELALARDSERKQDAVSRLMKAWENKNAQRAAKGLGLTMVAVSLAACGTETPAPEPEPVPVPPANLTITLSTAADGPNAVAPAVNTQGGDGNDTFIGVVGPDAAGSTLNNGDVILGGAGTDTLAVRVVTLGGPITVAPRVESVEVINVTNVSAASNASLDFASITGTTSIIASNSVAGSETRFIGVDAGTAIALDGNQGTVAVSMLGAAARTGTADAVTVAVAGSGTADAAATVNFVQADGTTADATFEVLNILTSGAASNVVFGLGAGADGARVLNVTGTAAANTQGYGLTTNDAATSLRTVDASGMTGTGGLSLTTATNQLTLNFTGSGQSDRLALSDITVLQAANLPQNTLSLNGGAGRDVLATVSTVTTTANADFVRNINTKVTNFEVLEFTTANISAFNAGLITSFNEFQFSAGGNATLAITGLTTADKVVFTGANFAPGAGSAVTLGGNGPGQTANIELGGGRSLLGFETAAGITFTGGVSTLAINSVGTGANTISATTTGIAVTNGAAVQNVVITGTTALNVVSGVAVGAGSDNTAFSAAVNINASGMSGALTIAGSAEADVIVLGSGADTLRATEGKDTITLGAGNDTLVYTNANQTFVGADAAALIASIDVVTDWGNGANTISLSGVANVGTAFVLQSVVQAAVVAAGGETASLANAFLAAANAIGAQGVGAFQHGGNTYVLANDATPGTLAAADVAIQLNGLHDLTATNFIL